MIPETDDQTDSYANVEWMMLLSDLPTGEAKLIDFYTKTVNGDFEINSRTVFKAHTVLIINGTLTIRPDTEQLLSNIEYLAVNGKLICPRSLAASIEKSVINGQSEYYPNEAILLDSKFSLDRYFPQRARKGALYWASDRIDFIDPDIDLKALADKNIKFETRTLIIAEEYFDEAVSMFNDDVKIEIVPSGMTAFFDDTILTNDLVNKCGGRIIVFGDLKLEDDFTAFESVDRLIVKGKVSLKAAQYDDFIMLDSMYQALKIITNARQIQDVLKAKIDSFLLNNSPEGVNVFDVAMVEIAADVDPAMILAKLKISDCALVKCHEKQESSVAAVSHDVGKIQAFSTDADNGDEPKAGIADMLDMLLTSKTINTAEYVM